LSPSPPCTDGSSASTRMPLRAMRASESDISAATSMWVANATMNSAITNAAMSSRGMPSSRTTSRTAAPGVASATRPPRALELAGHGEPEIPVVGVGRQHRLDVAVVHDGDAVAQRAQLRQLGGGDEQRQPLVAVE